jgi:hypothetical protein
MSPTNLLDRVRIASPCQASWDAMSGNERVRSCALCQKHVYNLSAMSAVEATALIERIEGNICARLYRRRDGTVLTADCPVGVRAVARRVRRLVAGAAVCLFGVITSAAVVRATSKDDPSSSYTPGSVGPMVMMQDWYDWTLEKLGIRQRVVVMGDVECIPTTPPGPSTPPVEPEVEAPEDAPSK